MRRLFPLSALLALSVSMGCSSEDAFCKKLQEFDPDGQADCKTDAVPEVKNRCENAEEVFSCVANAKDEAASDACIKVCKKKEKKAEDKK